MDIQCQGHDFAHKRVRNFNVVEVFDLLRDVTLRHTAGVEGENFLFHTICVAAVFSDDLGFIFAVAVTGNFDIDLAKLSFYTLFRVPVSVVFRRNIFAVSRHTLAFFVSQFSSSASMTCCRTSLNSSFMALKMSVVLVKF